VNLGLWGVKANGLDALANERVSVVGDDDEVDVGLMHDQSAFGEFAALFLAMAHRLRMKAMLLALCKLRICLSPRRMSRMVNCPSLRSS